MEAGQSVAPLRFAVGSANAAKVRAVEMVVTRIFPSRVVEVRGFNVPSSVAAQPMSAAETMQGADNRARAALSAAGSDFEFGIGLEVR
jgi:non-canonical (house-cleaning) NTP pyrophosphatase